MSLPDEKLRSTDLMRMLCYEILKPNLRNRLPDIRNRARSALKHFPYRFEFEKLAEHDKHGILKEKERA